MKRITLLCVLLCIAVNSHATQTTQTAKLSQSFTLTAQHCDLLQEATERMVEQNREGMSLEGSKFSVENEYNSGPKQLAYSQIKPFIYAVTEEYYSNHALAEIDYAPVIGRNCRENIGSNVKQ